MSAPIVVNSLGCFTFLVQLRVGDVDQAVYALLDLDEYAEVGEVAHLGGVFRCQPDSALRYPPRDPS